MIFGDEANVRGYARNPERMRKIAGFVGAFLALLAGRAGNVADRLLNSGDVGVTLANERGESGDDREVVGGQRFLPGRLAGGAEVGLPMDADLAATYTQALDHRRDLTGARVHPQHTTGPKHDSYL